MVGGSILIGLGVLFFLAQLFNVSAWDFLWPVTGLGWGHPITLVGIVAGALIVFALVAVLAGWRLPLIATDQAELMMAVVVIGLVKWGLALFSQLFLKV